MTETSFTFVAVFNIDLAVVAVLFFHFQVMAGHNHDKSQIKSGQISLYLSDMFDEVAGVEENTHESLNRYGG